VSKPPNTESRFGWRNLVTGHAAILLFLGAVVAAVLSRAVPEPTATAIILILAISLFAFVVWGSHRPR
jgi:Flp pilus assembly protein TadB